MKNSSDFRAAGAFGRKASERRADMQAVLDAEFVTLPADAAPDRPQPTREPPRSSEPRAAAGMALFDTPDALPETPKPDDRIAFYGFSALLVLLAFWVSGGHVLSDRFNPAHGAASRPVTLEQVTWRVEEGAAGPALLVDGLLRNHGARMAAMTPVSVIVRRSDGTVTRFRINPGAGSLAPGAQLGVNARLDLSATASTAAARRPLDRQPASIETVTVTLSQ